jgi:hypothetical protein
MSIAARAIDPTTNEAFWLSVDDVYGGHDAAVWTLEVFHELALRHRISFWELYQMLKLETLGPESLSPDYVDPLLELEKLRSHAHSDARLLAQPDCPLADAVAAWKRWWRYCELMAEHHPRAEVRAKYAAELAERESAMTAIVNRAKGKGSAS